MAIEQAHQRGMRNQRGAALVGALVIVGILATLAMIFMRSLTDHVKVTGYTIRSFQAADMAEAGITEAISRINTADVPDNGNPKQVTQIFLATNGTQPTLGSDSTALVTGQPAGAWLNYSTAQRSSDALTIAYKTTKDKTKIYRYSLAMNPRIQTVKGSPIFVVTSTGRVGPNRTRIRAEICREPLDLKLKGAVVSNSLVKFTGNAFVCGYNHRGDTPVATGTIGRTGIGGCNENPAIKHWETGSDDMTGIWTTGTINVGGGATDAGAPAEEQGMSGFYAGPWELIGMTPTKFFSWIGPGQSTPPVVFNGPIYLDNNGVAGDRSGDFHLDGTGSGFLYVDGNATINASFTYTGIVYVEGNVTLNGHAWVLGSIVMRGSPDVKIAGGATVLYSHDAILNALTSSLDDFVTISWREVPN
jgi:Tfp pilus assembly protein PilX